MPVFPKFFSIYTTVLHRNEMNYRKSSRTNFHYSYMILSWLPDSAVRKFENPATRIITILLQEGIQHPSILNTCIFSVFRQDNAQIINHTCQNYRQSGGCLKQLGIKSNQIRQSN
ncbi:hypothetical protein T4B_4493 [Trichinella pseudospiralis]|uniref:Uncharacterized protein n=1 Tax=Trichinella pseudospiralis TaxID=6337 RepID=A0A0V1HY57_TRIPS|nr:hypothetical protein T4A_5820 [Trichinella pseudospiralis]KRZ15280.1 hypothetical protein T4B_4493 [Trichinella pseudospiralis]